jgi:4-amino-4-deoxy-L-arabinose transferase-like glycosyltransferase
VNSSRRHFISSLVIGHWSLLVILVVYLALAIAYSLASPIYEPTDEVRHFRYVRHILVYRELPVQSAEGPRAQSHHPPLYYALGALVSWWVPVEQDVYYEPPPNPFWAYRYWELSFDNKNQYLHGVDEQFPFHGVTLAVYAVRWMTVLIGAGVVCVTYFIGREVSPDRPALAAGAAALVAFNPQFTYLSGAINNDILAGLCGAAVLWACVRLVRRGPSWRADVTMGLFYGLALLTKFNLVALLALIELAYALAVWRARDGSASRARAWRVFVRGNLIVLGLAALIAGWWFARNWVLYGDPTAMNMVNQLWKGSEASEGWWAVGQSLPYLWSSLWGRFGYGQLPLPEVVYQALFWFCVIALTGHLLPRRERGGFVVLIPLMASVVLFVGVVFYYIAIQPAGPMGRFLFPCLPAFAVLVSLGLSQIFPRRWDWLAGPVLAVVMAALAIYALVGVLAPAFGRPRPLTDAEIAAVPNRVDIDFGGTARLLGYKVAPTTVRPGEEVEVTLYWEPLARTGQNYAVFVHLLSDVGTMVAQRDTYPGLGRYLTTAWEPGVVFADTYRMHVPETAYAPDAGYVQVGLYLPDGPRLTTSDGRDALRLTTVEVLAHASEFPNPLDANFDGKAALVGYTLDRRIARPGETVRLTLYWRALAPMEKSYGVFAHVLGDRDQVWAWNDGWPVEGLAPTFTWEPGQIIEDVRDLTLGATTPPGFYDIEVGLHNEERLPIVAEDGHWLGNRVLLSKIRVVSESTDQESR